MRLGEGEQIGIWRSTSAAWQRWRGVVRGSVSLVASGCECSSQTESLQCWEQGQQRLVFWWARGFQKVR